METGQGLRIAIYSQDGFGLGHMQRTCSIAWELYRLRPDASILTFSDSQLGQFFPISPHHDYIKLPSIAKEGPGNWQATHLQMSFPDILINRWQVEGAYDGIERYYARILVFGMQDVYDIADQYLFPESAARKVFYCGYVTSLDNERNAYTIRARYLAGKTPDTRLIVVMAGGGADAFPMMSTLIEALPKVLEEQACTVAVITGPFMPVELIADLERRAVRLPIQMMETVNDSISYISAADLVIAMAG